MDDKPPTTGHVPDNEQMRPSRFPLNVSPAAAAGSPSITAEATSIRSRGLLSAIALALAALWPLGWSLGCSISDQHEAPGDRSPAAAHDGGPDPSQEIGPNAKVERVVDGDTIEVEVDGRRESVRLLGIDAPETVSPSKPVQCYGHEASAYLAHLLPAGIGVTLVRDVELRDQYDRLLAYVVRSDDLLFVNLDLVEKGYATVLSLEPNTYYESYFATAQSHAEADRTGLWGVCGGPDVPLE